MLNRQIDELGVQEVAKLSSSQEKITALQNLLVSKNKKFLYHKPPPLVSIFLDQFFSHDKVNFLKEKNGGEIQEICYHLQSYPSLKEPLLPYLVKVDMSFTATDEEKAGELLRALKKGEIFTHIDGVKWSQKQDEYHLCFLLKAPPKRASY